MIVSHRHDTMYHADVILHMYHADVILLFGPKISLEINMLEIIYYRFIFIYISSDHSNVWLKNEKNIFS